MLNHEAQLLGEWHLDTGGSAEDWALWGQIMEPRPLLEIPDHLLLRDWEAAKVEYQKCFSWLQKRSPSA
jgi:hypothetical protein